ncbi:hypothetical protein PsorP6_016781 [Peronosclerospora sorghi]|uniref:Uncharacterized protein n=1 Tax=Peronosclerospora sorghi TaxID=230839 RepID=A0ACC0WF68_9STRA|nr:hypothetical protein PsorP6_016781 [Peronosclerospora sorghi]
MSANRSAEKFVKQSVVASILPSLKRNLAKQPRSHHEASIVRASVAAIFRWKERKQQSLELLFVRRCVNENDTWSGQVAFPGGRRQKQNKMNLSSLEDESNKLADWESLRETAQRETMEEVGLDLTTPHVHWIGSLPPIRTHLRSLSVSTQVFFIDEAAEEHSYQPKLQESEIADVFWVDVQELFNVHRYHVLAYPLEDSLMSFQLHPFLQSIAKTLLGNMLFDCVYLPRPNHPYPDDECLLRRPAHDFVLWGLTLRAVVKIFTIAGAPLPMRPVAQRFESKILGDIVLYCMRFPDRALAGTATLSGLLLVGIVCSKL